MEIAPLRSFVGLALLWPASQSIISLCLSVLRDEPNRYRPPATVLLLAVASLRHKLINGGGYYYRLKVWLASFVFPGIMGSVSKSVHKARVAGPGAGMEEPTHDGYGEIHVFSYKQKCVEEHKRKYLKQKWYR
jgi:hypothetical protein